MKTLYTIFFLLSVSFNYSQNYLSKPIEKTKVESTFNAPLANKVLRNSQQKYDNSKKITCYSLMDFIFANHQFKERIDISNSSMLESVTLYSYNGSNYIMALIKHSTDSVIYIYCGISQESWNNFKYFGKIKSWGESFNYYIADNKCNCTEY